MYHLKVTINNQSKNSNESSNEDQFDVEEIGYEKAFLPDYLPDEDELIETLIVETPIVETPVECEFESGLR